MSPRERRIRDLMAARQRIDADLHRLGHLPDGTPIRRTPWRPVPLEALRAYYDAINKLDDPDETAERRAVLAHPERYP